MKVTKSTVNKWKLLKTGGDVSYIAGMLGVSQSTVSRAMNGHDCTEETVKAITDFYKARSERLKDAAKVSA